MTTTTLRAERRPPHQAFSGDAPEVEADIYARQSIDHADGIARQIEDCTREIHRRGWRVGRIRKDNDKSADSSKRQRSDYRPAYVELMRDMAAGAVQAVVVQDQDRLMRDVREGEDLIDVVQKTGTRVVFTRAGEVNLENPDGRMQVRLKAVIAKQETEKKGERQRRAGQGDAAQGKVPKRRAFGYCQDGTVNEAEAVVVRDAFARLFRGESLRAITRAMSASGLKTARGSDWADNNVRVVLLNPRYAAIRTYHGEPVGPGQWEPLITEEEHERAKAILTDPARRTSFGSARKWLGGGLYYCGECEAVTGELGVRLSIANNSAIKSGKVYTCRDGGWHVSRDAVAVDVLVRAVVEEKLSQPGGVELLTGSSPEMGPLRTAEKELEARLDTARDRLDRGVLDEEDFVRTKRTIKAELAVIRRKVTAAARSSVLARIGAADDPAAEFLNADLNVQREVIDALMVVVVGRSKRTYISKVTERGHSFGGQFFDPTTIQFRWRDAQPESDTHTP